MDTPKKGKTERDASDRDDLDRVDDTGTTAGDDASDANPPRTTTGKITAPKFGSAGSGGAEFEPGPERD